MGYVRERRLYKLVFEDDEFAGLEVTAKSASVDAYQRIAELSDLPTSTALSAEERAAVDDLFTAFAEVLVSWNLEEKNAEGGVDAVPATLAGLKSQDLPFAMAIILAWMNAVAGVSRPLDQRSTSGELEASLPMEVLNHLS